MPFLTTPLYAHEGEAHETSVDAGFHYAESLTFPYIAIPLFVLLLGAVILALRKIRIQPPAIAIIVLILLFSGSILGFLFVPLLGIFAITAGFALALTLVLGGIRKG